MGKQRKTRGMYDVALNYEKIYDAWKTVSHTCKNQRGLFEYAWDATTRTVGILEDLKNRCYEPERFECFMIFEPKPRLVMSQTVRDKVVNHFATREYLLPILEPMLIDTNVATRKDKGSRYAGEMIRKYLAKLKAEAPDRPIYALKVDVSKYFYSISHEILFEKLAKKIWDKDVLDLFRRIVDETNKPYINEKIDQCNARYDTDIPHYRKGYGLSIGAMSSQFLAIFYLNDLDHMIKERLGCKYYIRYMDDFLVLEHDLEKLKMAQNVIMEELERAELAVNPKTTFYNVTSGTGFPFLGYRYYYKDGILHADCLARTVRRVRRHLSDLRKADPEKCARSFESYRGYFENAVPERAMDDLMRL